MQSALEMDLDSIYCPANSSLQSTSEPDSVPSLGVLEMPRRPAWSFSEARESLEERERTHIQQWLDTILARFPASRLAYFELNLETWRQLWRVTEMSDLVLLIADIRHPVLLFIILLSSTRSVVLKLFD